MIFPADHARLARVSLMCVAVLLAPTQSIAQSADVRPLTRPDSVPRLEVRDPVTFGADLDAPASIGLHPARGNMVVDGQGRFVVPTIDFAELLVYEPNGRFAGVIGRPGEGPGEFSAIVRVLRDSADSLFVFQYGKVSVFAPGGDFARESRLNVRPQYGAVRLANGEFVVAAEHGVPAAAGLPLHILSDTGERLRSFGTDSPVVDPDRPRFTKRLIAAAGGNTFWATRSDRYELEQWDSSGRHMRTIEGNAEWFEPWPTDARQRPGEERPYPFVRDLASDEDGRVWVLLQVADENWRPGLRDDPDLTLLQALDGEFDTVVELIDTRNGVLLGRARFDRSAIGLAGPGLVYSIGEVESGDVAVTVWSVEDAAS